MEHLLLLAGDVHTGGKGEVEQVAACWRERERRERERERERGREIERVRWGGERNREREREREIRRGREMKIREIEKLHKEIYFP